jgi:hypothetical protein
MSTVQQWGRKESIIWPPQGYVYTLGAFLFACILTGVFVYKCSVELNSPCYTDRLPLRRARRQRFRPDGRRNAAVDRSAPVLRELESCFRRKLNVTLFSPEEFRRNRPITSSALR